MNLNTILDIVLNQRLGLVEYGLEELYPEIHNNLLTNTLPIFSQYFPCYRRYDYSPDDNKTEIRDEFYLNIPEIIENNLNIISVALVLPRGGAEAVNYFDGYRPINLSLEDVIMNAEATNTASLAKYSFRNFKYRPPNRIKLRGFGRATLTVILKIQHPSFTSITESVVEQFLDLATQDIKIFVYNKLKHYDQLQLPIGNIDLKLSSLEDGISGRDEVINRFNTKGYSNRALTHYYRYE